ncbi:hypothetical protein AB0M20_36565 [Actinoplanes sp. NPDC051633]|uniref:hypothetical protein n=1 Tax=Actinoplanes sp. NPDC051633 TaxID=3155670 RepID=UPI0034387610
MVNGGDSNRAIGVSSKPTTLRSPGTRRPLTLAASMTPAALSSVTAKMAVGGLGRPSSAVPRQVRPRSRIRHFVHSGPGRRLITVGILAFIASWNSYLLPLFILNDQNTFTLPLGVQSFASQYSVDTAKVLAFTSLSMIPALVFFSVFERRIVGGLTGAVKG